MHKCAPKIFKSVQKLNVPFLAWKCIHRQHWLLDAFVKPLDEILQTQYNHALIRIVQPIFSLQNNIPILIVKICFVCSDRIDNNGIECTICKYTYHFKCPDLPITSYYKTSNTWKCSKFKLLGPSSTCFFFWFIIFNILVFLSIFFGHLINWGLNQGALNNASRKEG